MGDHRRSLGQVVSLSLPRRVSSRKGEAPAGRAEGFLCAAGSGWPTAVSTRAWSSRAAASCTPSPASSTSGSRAGSRESRWAAAEGGLSRRQGSGSRHGGLGPVMQLPALSGPAAGGAGHLVQQPAGLRPLPHPEVPVCFPPLGVGLPGPAAVSAQVSGYPSPFPWGQEQGNSWGTRVDGDACCSCAWRGSRRPGHSCLSPQGPGTDVQDEGLRRAVP